MNIIKNKSALCLILLFVCINSTYAAKAPIKFGKPDIEDVEMTVYEPDSTAEAVILCNYGYFNSDRFEFIQTIRIKILKKSGTDWGDRSYSSMGTDTKVRGRTYNLENGELVESKLKKESIFKERVYDNYYNINVAMPNVKVGSVIDIQVVSFGLPRIWKFQELIPVELSELIVESSQYIDYQKNYFGYIGISQPSKGHWLASKVPAFKIEPYMDSYKNYISKFEFEIQRISFPGFYEDYASTWEQVAETLYESDYFGGIMKASCGFLKELAAKIGSSCTNDEEKLKMAYEEIKNIKWNDRKNNVSSTTAIGSVFKEKIGNSADINFLLIKLLDRLDIKAYPVVLSTRDNGQLSMFTPSSNKLNYLICCVETDGKKILLDPTEEKMPVGLIPVRAINNKGRLIYSKEKTEWISLSTDKKDTERIYHDLKLTDDHSITGTRSARFQDYAAYNKRKEYAGYNSEDDYLASCESEFSGLTITDFEFKNMDDIYSDLGENWTIKLKRHVEEIDDLLMINLNLFEQEKENKFKIEERSYPVNYPYCSYKQNTVKFEFPGNYTVSEVPEPIRLFLPEKGGSFLMTYSVQGNTIIMQSKIEINKTLFAQGEYPYLKEFFAQIVKKQAEPIILKKI